MRYSFEHLSKDSKNHLSRHAFDFILVKLLDMLHFFVGESLFLSISLGVVCKVQGQVPRVSPQSTYI
jgi:hypothetical protein